MTSLTYHSPCPSCRTLREAAGASGFSFGCQIPPQLEGSPGKSIGERKDWRKHQFRNGHLMDMYA